GRDEAVEHRLDLLVRDLEAGRREMRAGVREAERAVEVAGGVHLDEREAGVLLVVRAEAAVERAAVADLGRELQRDGARLVEPLDPRVEVGVAEDERLEPTVLRAALAHDDLAVTQQDPRVDDLPA